MSRTFTVVIPSAFTLNRPDDCICPSCGGRGQPVKLTMNTEERIELTVKHKTSECVTLLNSVFWSEPT